MLDNRKVIIDTELQLVNCTSAASVTFAGKVDGVAKVLDTGGGTTQGVMFINVAAITGSGQATNNQSIQIALEGSTTSTFTAWVRLAKLVLHPCKATTVHGRTGGDHSATLTTTTALGIYKVPFVNDFHGTVYRWLRAYVTFNGSQNAAVGLHSIDFEAWLSK